MCQGKTRDLRVCVKCVNFRVAVIDTECGHSGKKRTICRQGCIVADDFERGGFAMNGLSEKVIAYFSTDVIAKTGDMKDFESEEPTKYAEFMRYVNRDRSGE